MREEPEAWIMPPPGPATWPVQVMGLSYPLLAVLLLRRFLSLSENY